MWDFFDNMFGALSSVSKIGGNYATKEEILSNLEVQSLKKNLENKDVLDGILVHSQKALFKRFDIDASSEFNPFAEKAK